MTKALIINNKIDVCDYVKKFFEERNFIVFTALNSNEALRRLKKDKPHLVLLDIRIEGRAGIEILKKIQQIDKNIRTIVVTDIEDPEKINIARRFGAYKYLIEPLILEELETAVISHRKDGKNEYGI